MYLLYTFPPELHTLMDLVVLTSLTHPRKILLVALQIGKAKDLSAPLHSNNVDGTASKCRIIDEMMIWKEAIGE
jgi:hypothetical protein